MNFIIAVKADSYRVEQKVLLFRILSTSLADIKLFSFLFFFVRGVYAHFVSVGSTLIYSARYIFGVFFFY